jgi:hypothetical protein
MTTEHKNIYEAINAVMQEVGYVQKKKGGDIPYKFAGEAALIEALRPSMVEHGIFVYPSCVSNVVLEREFTTADKPKGYTHFHATYTFVFMHVSGTFVESQAEGEGIDYGDKAASKASTIAYKYALRQTFCIETGDDPDKYASDNDFGGLKSGNEEPQRGPSTNVKPQKAPQAAPAPASATKQAGAASIPPDKIIRPLSPTALQSWFDLMYEDMPVVGRDMLIDTDSAKDLAIKFKALGLHEDERRAFAVKMFGVNSFKEINEGIAAGMREWLKDVQSARREAQDFLAAMQPEPEKAA